jgi:hypothetical protein
MDSKVLGGWVCALLCALSVASTPVVASASEWDTRLWTGFELQGETDLDGPNGEFDYWMFVLGGSSSRAFDERVTLVLKGDYRAIGYDFDDTIIRDPWETVHVFRLNPTLQVKLNEAWSLLGGPILEFSGESDADFDDSVRGGAVFGVGYRHSENLHGALGLIVQSEIEDDTYVAPFIHVYWGIVEGLYLTAESESSRGGEFRLGYRFTEDFGVAVGGGFRRERFRLDDDGISSPFSRRDGVGQEEATTVSARFTWAFMDPLEFEGYIGSTLDGEFRLENKRGDKLIDVDYDDAVFGGMRLRVRF